MNEEAVQAPETAPETVPEPPVLELPSDAVPQPAPEPAGPPVEVISVDELIERLTQDGGELEEPAGDEGAEGQTDAPVEDSDPVALAVEEAAGTLADMIGSLGRIEEQTKAIGLDTDVIQEQVTVMAQAVNHPALTTSFADYTVTEGLLLFLLLAAFLSACARMLRGGLSWLRS